MVISKIFATSWFHSSRSQALTERLPIEQIRESLKAVLHDCQSETARRVIYQIESAATATDLWMLRSALHQCIAQAHSQNVAAHRINDLIEVFEGWIPPAQLTRI